MKRSQPVSTKWLSLVAFLMYAVFSTAQNPNNLQPQLIELSVAKYSDAPHTELVHEYLLRALNLTGQPVSLTISTTNVPCADKKNSNVDQEVYWDDQLGQPEALNQVTPDMIFQSQSSREFYVKLTRPLNTPLNTWNCTEIVAVGPNGEVLSNIITIQSFFPDPKDFR